MAFSMEVLKMLVIIVKALLFVFPILFLSHTHSHNVGAGASTCKSGALLRLRLWPANFGGELCDGPVSSASVVCKGMLPVDAGRGGSLLPTDNFTFPLSSAARRRIALSASDRPNIMRLRRLLRPPPPPPLLPSPETPLCERCADIVDGVGSAANEPFRPGTSLPRTDDDDVAAGVGADV
jgi:hypothetical protein